LNPIIYTLRNKDIIVALRKLLTKLLAWGKHIKLQKVFGCKFIVLFQQKRMFTFVPLCFTNNKQYYNYPY
jgi:hypothetical protein